MVNSEECIGFTYEYFTNLIHKIIKEGIFWFEIEDQIVFGHKTVIPIKEY